ncbi:MAG: hypothetical protein L0H54_07525 [Alcaligenaceae bacterium]|nr:hypothetical protein [Alcaligenaceae bacterium]
MSEQEFSGAFFIEDVEKLMGCMLQEVFIAAFSLKFGEMPEDIQQRIADAHPLQLREWIPSIVVAAKADDVFVTALERAFMPIVANASERQGGPCLREMGSLREMAEALGKASKPDAF